MSSPQFNSVRFGAVLTTTGAYSRQYFSIYQRCHEGLKQGMHTGILPSSLCTHRLTLLGVIYYAQLYKISTHNAPLQSWTHERNQGTHGYHDMYLLTLNQVCSALARATHHVGDFRAAYP